MNRGDSTVGERQGDLTTSAKDPREWREHAKALGGQLVFVHQLSYQIRDHLEKGATP